MGNKLVQVDTECVTEKDGSIIVYRKGFDKTLRETDNSLTLLKLFQDIANKIGYDAPFLYFIPPKQSQCTAYSYKQAEEMGIIIAKSIEALKLVQYKDDDQGKQYRPIGIMATTRVEWLILKIATWYTNITLVPLFPTYSKEALAHIINETELDTIFANSDCISTLVSLKKNKNLKFSQIISFEDEYDQQDGVEILTWKKLLEVGSKADIMLPKIDCDRIATICYTSGTTGLPKGVVITEKMMASICYQSFDLEYMGKMYKQKYFSCLPMAHVYESTIQMILMTRGASICFFRGDMRKLMEDIAIFKPFGTSFVPKLISRVINSIKGKTKELGRIKRFLFNKAISAKLSNLHSKNSYTHKIYDKLVLGKIRNALGGNMSFVVSGSAPISKDDYDLFQVLFNVKIIQGYGLTECCGGISIQTYDNYNVDVGAPISCAMVKLVSSPENGYTVNDINPTTKLPEPRGAVFIKGHNVFSRYFKNREATEKSVKDGWFETGDVGSITHGSIKIIDRISNIIKLSQGEYISPEYLEGLYSQCLYILQIFIYGEPIRSDIVAVIVPDKVSTTKWCIEHKKQISYEEACKDKEFIAEVAKDMYGIANKNGLNRWEFPKSIYLSSVEFSTENNTLTPTMKIKKKAAYLMYQHQIEDCFNGEYIIPKKEN